MFHAICKFSNLKIVLRNLEIVKLQTNFKTEIQLQNCAAQFWNMNMFSSIACLVRIYYVRIHI